jgi:hypothetical protein
VYSCDNADAAGNMGTGPAEDFAPTIVALITNFEAGELIVFNGDDAILYFIRT